MRKLALTVLLLCICMGAKAAQSSEPFGVLYKPVAPVSWIDERARLVEQDRALAASIEVKVRKYPREQWLVRVNQEVALAGIIKCMPTAFIKVQILRLLDFNANDLRLVVGSEDSDSDDDDGGHMTVAVRTAMDWLVLDNRHLIKGGYQVQPDWEVSGHNPHFHPSASYN